MAKRKRFVHAIEKRNPKFFATIFRKRFVNEREKERNVFRDTEKMETTRAFFETLRKWKLLERG